MYYQENEVNLRELLYPYVSTVNKFILKLKKNVQETNYLERLRELHNKVFQYLKKEIIEEEVKDIEVEVVELPRKWTCADYIITILYYIILAILMIFFIYLWTLFLKLVLMKIEKYKKKINSVIGQYFFLTNIIFYILVGIEFILSPLVTFHFVISLIITTPIVIIIRNVIIFKIYSSDEIPSVNWFLSDRMSLINKILSDKISPFQFFNMDNQLINRSVKTDKLKNWIVKIFNKGDKSIIPLSELTCDLAAQTFEERMKKKFPDFSSVNFRNMIGISYDFVWRLFIITNLIYSESIYLSYQAVSVSLLVEVNSADYFKIQDLDVSLLKNLGDLYSYIGL
jgi:hypothetical protein